MPLAGNLVLGTFSVNIPITADTYENIYILFDL